MSLSHNTGRVGGQMCLFLITQGEWVDRCVSFSYRRESGWTDVSLSHNAGRVGGQMCLFLIT